MATRTPVHMNLITVILNRYDKITTIMDEDFMEPVGSRVYESRTVYAQVVYGMQEELTASYAGDISKVKGHLTFRKSDVLITIQIGDRIISIDGETVDYEISEVRNTGHLRGGVNLLMAFFTEPSERDSIR